MTTAIGLMSGTSMDGIDAALLHTDGITIEAFGPTLTLPYDDDFRAALREVLGGAAADRVAAVAAGLTRCHALAVRRLLDEGGLDPASIDVIGFHGHTIDHRPADRVTVQIGDGDLLAELTGIAVVDDFRGADVAAGGQGAPLVPLFHAAMAASLARPLALLNLGGVGNVTWIGAAEAPVIAFDTGPGNALIDDWLAEVRGERMDVGGRLAAAGRVDAGVLAQLLDDPFFRRPPPKSLDRRDFDWAPVRGLSPADGAATLTAFTAAAVNRARDFLPEPPTRWLVCGGGRHNGTLMAALAAVLEAPVAPVEAVGWQGDALEAQAFAFLAVRSLRGLPLSLPTTTGVARPQTGGRLHPAGGVPLSG